MSDNKKSEIRGDIRKMLLDYAPESVVDSDIFMKINELVGLEARTLTYTPVEIGGYKNLEITNAKRMGKDHLSLTINKKNDAGESVSIWESLVKIRDITPFEGT